MGLPARGEPILCDCCGRQVVGYTHDGVLEWFIDHNGRRHFKTVVVTTTVNLSVEILDHAGRSQLLDKPPSLD